MSEPSPTKAEVDPAIRALRYDALTRQLERMRAMQYGYFSKFFWWVTLTLAGLIAMILAWDFWANAMIPFLVITAGVQASFYLYYVDFARVHSRALERRLNQLLGEEVLLGAKLEDQYFYPLDGPKLSGLSYAKPLGFFSAYTLHWCGVWALFFLYGFYNTCTSILQEVAEGDVYGGGLLVYAFYLVALGAWLLLNVGYLAWFFYARDDLRTMDQTLAEAYGAGA